MLESKPLKVRHVNVPSRERGQFTLNLMLLLKASVPVGEALLSLQETTDSKPMRRVMERMRHAVDDGVPLGEAMQQSGIITPQTIALVRIGEQSGQLVENLQVAATQEEKQRIFKSKVRSALIYPLFVITVTLLVGLAVSWFLLPKLAITFSQLNVKLPLISRIFIDFGQFLKRDGYWAVPLAVAALLGGIYLLFGAPKTRSLGQRLLLHIPGIKTLVRDIEIARFGYLMGMLLEAGLTVMQAWQLLATATNSPRYIKLYHWLTDQFENGYSFKTSFRGNKMVRPLLPVTVQQMVIAAERSGNLPETLLNIGKMYEERADIATANLESTLEPILLVLVAFGVLAVAIAVILPIYGLLGGLSQ